MVNQYFVEKRVDEKVLQFGHLLAVWPKGSRRRFYDDPDRIAWIQLAPWSLFCFRLDKVLYANCLCLVAMANLRERTQTPNGKVGKTHKRLRIYERSGRSRRGASGSRVTVQCCQLNNSNWQH